MGTEITPFKQMEVMAMSIVKSGFMMGLKTQEQALTMLMIADAEGIKPIQAIQDYDIINGKPSLKSSAMLGRFQRAGGTVKWIEASDARVTGEFTHPAGGTVRVTWDQARVEAAGLLRNPLHKTNGQQMKRARCITEGIRAVYPACIPNGIYSPEETQDIEVQQQAVNVEQAIQAAGNQMMPAMLDEFLQQIREASNVPILRATYGVAYTAAKAKNDDAAMNALHGAYIERKEKIEAPDTKVAAEAAQPTRDQAADGEVI